MSGIRVAGVGAVSPAGWGTAALRAALEQGTPILPTLVPRPGGGQALPVREVPRLVPVPAWAKHPRLRRASPITLHAVGAVREALSMAGSSEPPAKDLGLILCLLAGCVQYTERFFGEVLRDPASASPLLFPETVFNGPASHVAAVLGRTPLTYTLLGDPSVFLQGLDLAAEWLAAGYVDDCLVVGAEETSWLLADALLQFDHSVQAAGGAGAVLLTRTPTPSPGVELEQVTDLQVYAQAQSRPAAAGRMRAMLSESAAGGLLCDSRVGSARLDAAETRVWRDWPGARVSPKLVLGEGLMAASAWQCVTAIDALSRGQHRVALISVVGQNEAAAGARFVRAGP
ncbi:MAG: hypothetical protein HS113_24365 [Verrucomicrobiales bacterium]|nr:hypothetical protein [Verrucomicrobiales bacterium]